MNNRKRIAVLGLYRSGSTALAGVLHHLGVDMGAPFFRDYFESRWLAEQLRAWWNEPWLEEKCPPWERVRLLGQWIRQQEARGAACVGAKHPLLTLCSDDLLEAWGPDTRFLWSYRPIEESIHSLASKGWFPDSGFPQRILWEKACCFFGSHEHLRIELTEMLMDPRNQVRRIIDYLGMTPSAEQVERAAAFIQPKRL